MEITKFSEKDMNAAISMARQTWHGYYDEFRAEYIRCIAECIVRHNYTDEDLAFKITCNGEVKGIIFGTRKGKMADLSVWVGEQCKTMNPQEKELLERLNDYMDEADRNTIAQMGDGDVKLSYSLAYRSGCGRELLRARCRSSAQWALNGCSYGQTLRATTIIILPTVLPWLPGIVIRITLPRKQIT